MSLANLITLARLPLLLALVAMLFVPSLAVQLAGLGLLIVLFLMDWFDGYVARVRHEVTEMGAVLDVALDRAVENILWLTFMYLAMVPLWVPIVFLLRSFIVDGIRGVALARGKSGFGMMHSPLGKFLVASRFMRALYGLAKAVVFCLLYLTHALALKYPGAPLTLHPLNQGLILLAVGLCVVRGIPVLLDGRIYFGAQKSQAP
ncbi:MAG TPA: CDP-alcohol phosphatidyltransferase family protein [Desulfobaccales bacterium]